ncbi:unnamed protein product [Discosporangium mesarthrocarpum]
MGFYGEEKSEEGCRPVYSRSLRWGEWGDLCELLEENGPFDVLLGSALIYPERVSGRNGGEGGWSCSSGASRESALGLG